MQEEEEENNPFSARNIERRVVHELNTNKATLIALGVALLKTAGKEITWRDVSTFMNALTIQGSGERNTVNCTVLVPVLPQQHICEL